MTTDRYIDEIGDTNVHRIIVGVRDGKLGRTILDGKMHPCITWSNGRMELTASIPELGIEAIVGLISQQLLDRYKKPS